MSEKLAEEDTDVHCFVKLSNIPFQGMSSGKKMPGKIKIMYLNLYKLTSFTVVFQWVLTVNSKSNCTTNIFLRLSKDIPVFLSLLSFSVLVIYVCYCFLWSASFQQHINNFLHQLPKLFALSHSLNRLLFNRFI